MNEGLLKYLIELGCRVINPCYESHRKTRIVGWHCKASSAYLKQDPLRKIREYMRENKLRLYINDVEDAIDFFIYHNEEKGY